MCLGKLVETASSDDLYNKPLYHYSKLLLAAALPADPTGVLRQIALKGEVSNALNPPPECRLHLRCPLAFDSCASGSGAETPGRLSPLLDYGLQWHPLFSSHKRDLRAEVIGKADTE